MSYIVTIKRSAEKELDALSPGTFERVKETILLLELEPRPNGCRKLRGAEEYRLRVGAYRILYTVDDKQRLVEIMSVGHHRDVYRGRK